jgi:hypothetical protein
MAVAHGPASGKALREATDHHPIHSVHPSLAAAAAWCWLLRWSIDGQKSPRNRVLRSAVKPCWLAAARHTPRPGPCVPWPSMSYLPLLIPISAGIIHDINPQIVESSPCIIIRPFSAAAAKGLSTGRQLHNSGNPARLPFSGPVSRQSAEMACACAVQDQPLHPMHATELLLSLSSFAGPKVSICRNTQSTEQQQNDGG